MSGNRKASDFRKARDLEHMERPLRTWGGGGGGGGGGASREGGREGEREREGEKRERKRDCPQSWTETDNDTMRWLLLSSSGYKGEPLKLDDNSVFKSELERMPREKKKKDKELLGLAEVKSRCWYRMCVWWGGVREG